MRKLGFSFCFFRYLQQTRFVGTVAVQLYNCCKTRGKISSHFYYIKETLPVVMSADNKGAFNINMDNTSAILLDVAGTTTSIGFVKDILFPYIIEQAEAYLKKNWENEDVISVIKILKTSENELDVEAATKLVKELTESNSENEGLKILQGLIAKIGYESGDLKAHVFADVAPALDSWSKNNKKIAIYSTGSCEAQKLLFSHTTEGDLTSHINNYFDQSVGNKTDSASYEKIVKKLNVKPEETVFITDLEKEAKAAKSAGLVPVLVSREGNENIDDSLCKDYVIITSLTELFSDNMSKRKKTEELETEVPPSKVAKTDESEADVKDVSLVSTEKVETAVQSKELSETSKCQALEKEEAMEVDSTEGDEVIKKQNKEQTIENIMDTSEVPTTSTEKIEKEVDNKKDEQTEDSEKTETTKNKKTEEGTSESGDNIKSTEDKKEKSDKTDSAEIEKTNNCEKAKNQNKLEESKIEAESVEEKQETTEKEDKESKQETTDPTNEQLVKTDSITESDEKELVEKIQHNVDKENDAKILTEQIKETEITKQENEEKTIDKELVLDNEKMEESAETRIEAQTDVTKEEKIEESKENGSLNKEDEEVPSISEEKENKSDLANGAEKTNGEEVTKNGESEPRVEKIPETEKPEECEIKVKQIEPNTETTATPVSVEV